MQFQKLFANAMTRILTIMPVALFYAVFTGYFLKGQVFVLTIAVIWQVVGLFAYRSYFNKKYTLSVLYSGSLALLIIICLSILRVNGYEDLGVLIILFLLCLFLYSGYVYKHGKLLDTYDGFERNQITTVLGYFVLFYYSFSWTFKLCIVVAYAFGIGDIINCVACEFYEI